jgi:membrane protease YdiL (CAAX protease family)
MDVDLRRFSREEWELCAAVIALSGMLNGQLPAPFRIPAGLAGCVLVGALAARSGVEAEEMGVSAKCLGRGVATGVAVGVPLSSIIAGVTLLSSTRGLYGSQQIKEASPGRAFYEAFVRIPAATALPEEFIFRGALSAALSRRHGAEFSVAASSLLFGLWHVGPALRQSGAKGYGLASVPQRVLHAAASVAGTALGGVGLALLRRRTGSLAAPWLVHAAVNGSGFLAGWLALRAEGHKSWKTPEPTTVRLQLPATLVGA